MKRNPLIGAIDRLDIPDEENINPLDCIILDN